MMPLRPEQANKERFVSELGFVGVSELSSRSSAIRLRWRFLRSCSSSSRVIGLLVVDVEEVVVAEIAQNHTLEPLELDMP